MTSATNSPGGQDVNRVIIFDTTLRDGEQSPGCSMNLEEKLQIASVLEAMGVDVIEAGFPIASNGDFEAVREVSRLVKGSSVAGLARSRVPSPIVFSWGWRSLEPASLSLPRSRDMCALWSCPSLRSSTMCRNGRHSS